jgi:hypothetical protein
MLYPVDIPAVSASYFPWHRCLHHACRRAADGVRITILMHRRGARTDAFSVAASQMHLHVRAAATISAMPGLIDI